MKQLFILFAVLVFTVSPLFADWFDGTGLPVPPESCYPNSDFFLSDDLIQSNTIVGFYGKPGSPVMGILGRLPKDELADLLYSYVREYAKSKNGMGAIPAFYIIYGTCQPGGEIGYMPKRTVEAWIEYALSNKIVVVIDHQIGKYEVEDAMNHILPYLKYPNVHLALDPEWRTEKPMQEIGSVSAEELNHAQDMMDGYMVSNRIMGRRMLVVHQFHYRMIRNIQKVRNGSEQIELVHCMDGFGPPSLKMGTWKLVMQATNLTTKGFKLFFRSDFPNSGYDDPILSPGQVLSLNTRPSLVIYQ